MRISQLGIQLQLLQQPDIELVRQWRNSPQVNEQLFNTDLITAEQQLLWYNKIQTEQNLYFLIIHNGIKCGLVYLTNINWFTRSFETNIFMGLPEYQSSFVPVYAALIVSDLFFIYLGFQTATSSTVAGNSIAGFFDENFGYATTAVKDDRHLLQSDKDSFLKATERLRRVIGRTGKFSEPVVVYAPEDLTKPMCGHFLKGLLKKGDVKFPPGFQPVTFLLS